MRHLDSAHIFSSTTWLRGLAITAVLLIHSTAPVLAPRWPVSAPWIAVLTALNQAARYSVPLFFFLSGLLYGFLYAERKINYAVFLRKRVEKILLPYTFWFCFYLFMRVATGDIPVHQLSAKYLLILYGSGGAAGHLYFIPAIFQFYLLLPFLLASSRKISATNNLYVFWTACTTIMLVFLHFRTTFGLGHPVASEFCRSYWFFWWAPFSLLGLQCGNDMAQKRPPQYPTAWLVGLVIILFLILWYEYMTAYFGITPYDRQALTVDFSRVATFLRPSAFIYAMACCLLSCRLITGTRLPWSIVFESLGVYSFGIYLVHPFVNKSLLKVCKIFGMDLTGTFWSVGLLFFIGSSLTYLLVWAFSKIGVSKYIFGPLH